MKDTRVLRGRCRTFQYDGAVHLVVDDGNFNDAWRVTRFAISFESPHDSSLASRDAVAALATHPGALTHPLVSTVIDWNWADRRQVAWTSIEFNGDTTIGHWQTTGLIDPQHVVVRDLYLGLTAQTASSTINFNYFIQLERVTLNDNQAVMALVQEVA
jgi:hypothetical protein